MELHELGLSVRAFNAVCRAGLRSVMELHDWQRYRREDLQNWVGKKSLAEIDTAFAELEEKNMIEITTKCPPAPAEQTTPEYLAAFNLNARIHYCKDSVERGLAEMCIGIEQMRNGKQYKVLGYSNFEEYCQTEFGFSRMNGVRYADIGKMLNGQNVTSMLQNADSLGMTKLSLLAKLDEPTREVLTEQVDVENVTVKDLKAQIESLRNAKEKAEKKLSVMTEDRDRKEAARQKCFDRFKEIAAEKRELQARIDELKSSPQQVSVEDVSRIEELEAELAAKQKELDERPIQETFTDGWSQQRRGKFTALCESLDAQLGTVLAFLEANDQCSDFGWFAQNIKNKLRSWNTKINELLSEDQKEET